MRYLSTLIIVLSFVKLQGQVVMVYKNYENEKLSFRIKINNNETWTNALLTGFLIKRTNIKTGEEKRYEVKNITLKYVTNNTELESAKTTVAVLLDNNSDHESFISYMLEGLEFDISEIDMLRRGIVEYMLNKNYQLIMESGFGYQDSFLDLNAEYEYEITNLRPVIKPENKIEIKFRFNPSEYEFPTIPRIDPKWENKKVTLKWNTRARNDIFYGYEVQQSINGGEFSILDSIIINPQDTSSDEALHYIYDRVLIDNNDSIYTFRIYGKDYLGLRSKNYSEVTGQGNIGIGASPSIDNSELLNSNEVDLRWSIYPQFKDNVKEWRIYLGEDWDGPYDIDSSGINPETNKLIRPLPFENNFFRVVAIDLNGDEHSSFPTLVTHLDTIPPAIPSNLSAIIDSAGIVNLDWDDNFEKDFYGYKVFYGFDTTREMTLAHNKAIPLSMFTDTVGLKSVNRKLYYKVTSIDNRNNRSEFSKIVNLIKPDVISPMEPNFHLQKSGPGMVRLAWYRSTSGDVINQKLFRKKLSGEVDWTLIKEWDKEVIDTSYNDAELESLESYAYILTVMDSSGNTSLPSTPAIVTTLPDHGDVNLEQWSVELDGKKVRFEHDFTNAEIYEIRLYRQEALETPFEIAKFTKEIFSWDDEAIIKDKSYQYFVQLVFEDGFQSKYSPKQIIIYE